MQKDRDFALRDARKAATRGVGRISVYRVKTVDGALLRLEVEGDATAPGGWAADVDVVPIDQAMIFFTGRIRTNPRDGFSCSMRARDPDGARDRAAAGDPFDARFPRHPFADPDRADRAQARAGDEPDLDDLRPSPAGPDADLGDFTTAIRLDPKSAAARRGRGLIRVRMEEYDRAIADFDAAIRLEPWNRLGHHGRATAWTARGDLDRAISISIEASNSMRRMPSTTRNAPACGSAGRSMTARSPTATG